MPTPRDDDIAPIHRASTGDVSFMAAVFAAKRAEYEVYSPVFWRQAAGARAVHEPFLQMLVEQDGPVAFVATDGDASDVGGAIVAVRRADDWLVDDFGVLQPEQWWVRPLDDVATPGPAEPEGATGLVVTAPPVYDPGGQVCQVVAWDGTAGALRSIEQWSRGQGAVLAIVPVPGNAIDRQAALREAGYTVASEWYRFEAAGPD